MNRYRDWGEIRYSMRSAFMNAPWLRRVYLVVASAEHVPAWLNITHPSIRVIYHHQLFDDPAHMPTFNSLAIESVLHRIPDLSEQFIYFNNDVFLGAPTPLSRFATRTVYRRCVDWPLIGAGLRGKAARRANPCLAAIDVATAQHFWASNRPTQPHTPPPPATLRQCAAPPAGAEHPLDRWVAQIVFNQPLHHWYRFLSVIVHSAWLVSVILIFYAQVLSQTAPDASSVDRRDRASTVGPIRTIATRACSRPRRRPVHVYAIRGVRARARGRAQSRGGRVAAALVPHELHRLADAVAGGRDQRHSAATGAVAR
jgi:hypothetical protein